MTAMVGVLLHAIGGLAAGSFYLPLKRVRGWSWESYWLVNGIASWLVVPWLIAILTVPNLWAVLAEAPRSSLVWAFTYGVLWGIGGLTFGLTMRYLGMSLGYAVAIGFTAAFGTLVPPVYYGEFAALVMKAAGRVTLAGVLASLLGIAIVGWAGVRKDRELSPDQKKKGVREFDLVKGLWVAVFAGIMSACMAFGIAAGQPIAETAQAQGTAALWQNSPVFVIIFAGGLVTNAVWCIYRNLRSGSWRDYVRAGSAAQWVNYGLAAAAGTIWYLQFMFYGMGTTKLGAFEFASWSIHMAFVIACSNAWGLATREWAGARRRTIAILFGGLAVLVLSTVIIGLGSYLEASRP